MLVNDGYKLSLPLPALDISKKAKVLDYITWTMMRVAVLESCPRVLTEVEEKVRW